MQVDARLLVWLSPAFPVGAFAYSHGLELAADRGWVVGRDGLEAWISDLVACGSLRNDLILLAEAWRAGAAEDQNAVSAVNDLALALQPSAERRLETVGQGQAFLAAIHAAWEPDGAARRVRCDGEAAYAVAVGATAGRHGIELEGTLLAYAIQFVTNLVSAGIRLSLIGQTDGQRILAAMMPALHAAASAAHSATLDDLGGATLRSDLASLAHETQYSRLFRS